MFLKLRYRELVIFKTYSNLRAEASRNYLSFLWWVFEPILSMVVFYIVFGVLLKRGTEDYVPFLLVGLTTWQWFANTIAHGMTSILGNNALMNQVHLPKIIFPLIIILMDLFKFSIVFILIIIFLWIYGFSIGLPYLALPVLLLVQLLLITAVTCMIAAIIPFVPDLRFLVQTALQLAFFLTGIFFSASSISEQNLFYFYLNPMANLIEDYRNILMHNQWPDWGPIGLIAFFSIAGIYASLRIIKRFDYIYPRIIMQ